MSAGHSFDPPAFFLSAGYFLGVLVGSFLLGFIFTVITAFISFHPLPSLPLHPKLNYHLSIRCNLSTSSTCSLGCVRILGWKHQSSSCCPGAASSQLKPVDFQASIPDCMR